MGIGPWSEERGAKEGRNTASKITSDEVCSEGCCGLTGLPMYSVLTEVSTEQSVTDYVPTVALLCMR